MHNPTTTVLAKEAFLLAALGGDACVAFQVSYCIWWEIEGGEHEADAVGAAGLALAFEAVADVDF